MSYCHHFASVVVHRPQTFPISLELMEQNFVIQIFITFANSTHEFVQRVTRQVVPQAEQERINLPELLR
jgi:hypothetical protein